MGRRVLGEKIEVSGDAIKDFYDNRAKVCARFEYEYTPVLLKDSDPEAARKSDEYEKREILPLLRVGPTSSVLDIGCGMGRWADAFKDVCGKYVGLDFSTEMVKLAQRRLKNERLRFIASSFEDLDKNMEPECRFNRVIIGGTCMYINDDALAMCFRRLLPFLERNCILYLTESVALEERLSLDAVDSEALGARYSVIYRTPGEYNETYKAFFDDGFVLSKQFFPFAPHGGANDKNDIHSHAVGET